MTRTIEQMADFVHGEHIAFSVLGKERGGATAIASAASVTLTITIAERRGGTPIYEFTDADAQITLADAATAQWDVSIASSAIPNLVEGRSYWIDIWCTKASGEIIHQKKAHLVLRSSAELT